MSQVPRASKNNRQSSKTSMVRSGERAGRDSTQVKTKLDSEFQKKLFCSIWL